MPRTGPILVILALTVACSATGQRRLEPGRERPAVSLSTPDPIALEALRYAAEYRPALGDCVEQATDTRGNCLLCETAGGVSADELAGLWTARASDSASDAGWILHGIQGADDRPGYASWPGLQPVGERLRVCFERPTPDWRERLRHRSLWVADGAPRQSFDLRSVDLADTELRILSGRALSRARSESPERTLRRLERWDARYGLWADRSARWTGDPVFRRWLSSSIDRQSIASLLFDGHATTDSGWVLERFEPPAPPERLAFASDSRPRIGIGFRGDDPASRSIAARLKAQLATLGVELQLISDPDPARSSGRPALWLLCHRPTLDDPLLGLLETLRSPADPTAEARQRLAWATTLPDRSGRASRAALLESEWIADGELIPLVAVENWLSSVSSEFRVESAAFGLLELREGRR